MSDDSLRAADTGVSVAITGSGGSGAVTAGLILLDAAAQAGFYGLLTRSAGPQIRGGESAAMVRFARGPVDCMGDRFDVMVGLDWLNVSRFVDEITLDDGSVILADPAAGEVPEVLTTSGARVRETPFKEIASGVDGGRINMASLGALGAVVGLPLSALEAGVRRTLKRKGAEVVDSAVACIRAGYGGNATAEGNPEATERWNISGNEAGGLGALRGGIRFVAAYPITPASEMLEWLAPRLERVGGSLLQAEDELASVNMIIGSSFGGVPSLTATSGPGLSLMMEGLGLAVTSETPVVVANVMRGGPSTGIPTKSEQSDLNIAVYGFHGDAPHLVLAALNIRDCVFTTQWAVRLAEHLQTVAIVLSDQSLGQSRAVIDPPSTLDLSLERLVEAEPGRDYQRYEVTDSGVSPMSLPGTASGMYTADGLEHNPRGTPSSSAGDHQVQLVKRLRKLADFDFGPHWAEISGDGELCLITWGSASGAAFEAADRLRGSGTPTRVIALRLLAPMRRQAMQDALAGARRVCVVEQNQGAQLYHYLHAEQLLPPHACAFARPGPLPLRPGEIIDAIGREA
jgi:2-oxoglutarate ferredoxin oxidoreductase subunit alpha